MNLREPIKHRDTVSRVIALATDVIRPLRPPGSDNPTDLYHLSTHPTSGHHEVDGQLATASMRRIEECPCALALSKKVHEMLVTQ